MKFCKLPFTSIRIILNGDVILCCWNYTYVIGNIFKDSFEDIWYGEKIKELRKSILDGSYRHCDKKDCFYCGWMFEDLNENFVENPPYPERVKLCYSDACNVKCMFCRDEFILESKKQTLYYDSYIDKIIDICKNAKVIYLNGQGEFLASSHFRNLIKLITKKYPDVKFEIITNGLLCTEKIFKELDIVDRLVGIYISTSAATKKTYEKIVRGGRWNQLQKNLKYLAKEKKKKHFAFKLQFVLNSLNYKEMPKFVKMANKLGAEALIWRFFGTWSNSDMCKNQEKYTCWDPEHKDYKKFLKVLNKLKRMDGYNFNEEFLKNLQSQTKDPWWVRVKNNLKVKL